MRGLLFFLVFEAAEEGVDEGLEHFGDASGLLDHGSGVFQGGLAEALADTLGNVELGSQFSAGAFGVAEEFDEFGGAVALAAFGDVGWDRERGALHLAAHRKVLGLGECDMDIDGEVASTLPDFEVLKCFNFTHDFFFH